MLLSPFVDTKRLEFPCLWIELPYIWFRLKATQVPSVLGVLETIQADLTLQELVTDVVTNVFSSTGHGDRCRR